MSDVSIAPPATADSTVCSQWTTRDDVARLAVHSHLPSVEHAHFGQYKTAKSLYDAVVARYSSPATAALSRLMLPYLFSDLAAFATVADLITHLRTSDTRYRAALPTEFCAKNPPPHVLLAATVAPLSLRGVPLSPFSPLLLLLLLLTSLALRRSGLRLLLVGGAATARAMGARVVEGTVGAAVEAVDEAEGVAVEVGVVAGVEASVVAVGLVEVAAAVVEAAAVVVEVAAAVVLVELREWYAGRGRSGGAGPCTFVLRTGGHRGEMCGLPHTAQRFFGRLTDAWRAQFPDVVELPRWGDLLLQNVAIFDLDFDAILAAMYAVTDSAEGDCYLSVPPDPDIEAAALGASASTAPGTGESAAPGAGESAAPGAGESALSGTAPTEALHTFTLDSGASRSFFRDSTILTLLSRPVAVSLADPSGGPVLAHSSTVLPCRAAPSGLLSGLHLPSFSTNLASGDDLQELWVDQFTPGGQRVTHCTCSRTGRHLATFTHRPGSSLYILTTTSPPVTPSGQVAAYSQVFAAVSRSNPASPPCSSRPLSHKTLLWHHCLGHPSLPRLRGMASRTLRATPHSSTFPPTEAPLQTLHMDVWGPARARGQGHECYFLLVVDDYSRYTTVFPLRSKGDITERRIGLVMDVARTSMIHAVAPHFLWPFAVQYVAHQINLQPRVSLPETTPTLRWTGKVGDASVFCVWGSRAFVRDTSADKLSSRAVPCIFLSFPPDAPGWQFYHPTSRRVLSSQDVTFDESGPAPSGVSQVDPAEPVKVVVDSGAARGTEPAGVVPGGAEPERVEPGGAESGGAESGRAKPWGAEPERVDPGGTASGGAKPARAESGGSPGRCRGAAGAGGTVGVAGGATGNGPAGGATGAGAAGGTGAHTIGIGAAGAGGVAGVVAGDHGAEGAGVVSVVSGGAARPRPYNVPLLQQVLGLPPSFGPTPPSLSPLPVWSQSQLQPASPLPSPSPYFGPTRGLTERRQPESRPVSPESCPASPASHSASPVRTIRAGRRVLCPRPPPVLRTHSMTQRPSIALQRVPLPSPPASSLPDGPDPESESLCAASPAVTRFLATAIADPLFESTAASALVAELVDFAVACILDYATSLVAASVSASVHPLSVGEGDPDAPDIPTPRSYAEAIEGPYYSQWQAAMDAEMASWKSTRTYVDEVPPPGANMVSGMWIFRVKRPPGSLPVFKARYVAHGFS
ncbi:unnamed protein product [Closterium sp. NIES-54]